MTISSNYFTVSTPKLINLNHIKPAPCGCWMFLTVLHSEKQWWPSGCWAESLHRSLPAGPTLPGHGTASPCHRTYCQQSSSQWPLTQRLTSGRRADAVWNNSILYTSSSGSSLGSKHRGGAVVYFSIPNFIFLSPVTYSGASIRQSNSGENNFQIKSM